MDVGKMLPKLLGCIYLIYLCRNEVEKANAESRTTKIGTGPLIDIDMHKGIEKVRSSDSHAHCNRQI